MYMLFSQFEDGKPVKGSLQSAMELDGVDDNFMFFVVSGGLLSHYLALTLRKDIFQAAAAKYLDKGVYLDGQRKMSLDLYMFDVRF